MTFKKGYFVWMLVFVLLVFAGCKKGSDVIVKDGQKELVEKVLKKIVQKMNPEGPLAKTKKIQRSLAKHILKDHIALMAHFQSGEFEKMKDNLGEAEVRIGGSGSWAKPNAQFWDDLHGEKAKDYDLTKISIELVIYATDIPLADIVSDPDEAIQDDATQVKEDCESTEFFKFKVIAVDENGDIISNQDGEGRRGRFHSDGCPWG